MKCVICGKEIDESCYMNAILCSQKCFVDHYWKEIIEEKDKHVVIDGTCYMLGEPLSTHNTDIAGFGGRIFYIRYFDGRVIQTNNLWFNGEVPDKHKEILKNEAEFYYPQIDNKGGADH